MFDVKILVVDERTNDELVEIAKLVLATLENRALKQNDFRAIASIMKIDMALGKIIK